MKLIDIAAPITEEVARSLSIGDAVRVSGVIVSARDEAHRFLSRAIDNETLSLPEEKAFIDLKPLLNDGIVYHCGPIVAETEDGFVVTSAGPTTSAREERYMPKIIRALGVRAVMGKGGLGEGTSEALKDYGAVYINLTGGAAALFAEKITKIERVFLREAFGETEAVWALVADGLPGIVTMDANGRSLHRDIRDEARKRFLRMTE